MTTRQKGRAAPLAPKVSGSARAKAPTTRPSTSTTIKPPAVAPAASSAAVIGQTPQQALRPPLEKALDAFTRELRTALDRAAADSATLRAEVNALRAEVNALRAELEQLRQRHASHTHSYQLAHIGGGGHQWIELRFLQGYIDGEHPGFTKWGLWAHGKSTSGQPAEQFTSGPSA